MTILSLCDGGGFAAVGHMFGVNVSTICSIYKVYGNDSYIANSCVSVLFLNQNTAINEDRVINPRVT